MSLEINAQVWIASMSPDPRDQAPVSAHTRRVWTLASHDWGGIRLTLP